jgi:hypothetical protein
MDGQGLEGGLYSDAPQVSRRYAKIPPEREKSGLLLGNIFALLDI